MILADQDLGSYNTDMVSDEVLNEVKRRLVDGFHPDKIILFGSQARGTTDDHSDVDILVVLTPEEYKRDRNIPGTAARSASLEGRVIYEGTR